MAGRADLAPRAAPVAGQGAEVEAALASIGEGGFTEAATRVGLLARARGEGRRKLSTIKQIRELVGDDVGLVALSAQEAQAAIRRQSIIVDHAPDAALATLPRLLPRPEDRSRLLALLDRLASRIALGPEVEGVLADVRRTLDEDAAGSAFAPPAPARPVALRR